MQCPEIKGLSFDRSSLDAINQIREVQQLGDMLTVFLGTSVLAKIFIGREGFSKPLGVGWSISHYDWLLWSQSMRSVPNLVSRQVKDIAFDQYTKHLSGDEHEFWRAVMYGCGY
ncbi:MAG: hypothetical protein OEW08_10775 [Gammaproteobacteria bacterium]|nr:hypothetical protein [Gammaproteobacteria bacterium]